MQAVLDAHNAYRAKHCVPALTWSTELAASAQQWANRCQFDHDDQSPHGENLFWGAVGAFSPRSAVTAWYEEIGEHDFSKPELDDQAGHFTQVVWRSTKQLGCAHRRVPWQPLLGLPLFTARQCWRAACSQCAQTLQLTRAHLDRHANST